MTNQRVEGSSIGMILNMKKEIVKLGVTGSYKEAIAFKQSYVKGYEINPIYIPLIVRRKLTGGAQLPLVSR